MSSVVRGAGWVELRAHECAWTHGRVGDPEWSSAVTVWDLVRGALRRGGSLPLFAHKTRVVDTGGFSGYRWLSHADVLGMVASLAGHLSSPPSDLRRGAAVGLLLPNSPQWLVADFALARIAAVSVPVPPTLGADRISRIVEETDPVLIICSAEALAGLLEVVASLRKARTATARSLREILAVSTAIGIVESLDVGERNREAARELGVRLTTWDEAMRARPLCEEDSHASDPAVDLWTIAYTSGTTGESSGVMVSHRSAVNSFRSLATSHVWSRDDQGPDVIVHFSYLPLAHCFERSVCYAALLCGAQIGFFSGSLPHLFEDVIELRPTFLIGVPRVWKRFQEKIRQRVKDTGYLARLLFWLALRAKRKAEEPESASWFDKMDCCSRSVDWEALAMTSVRQLFGGRCRFIISSGAPLGTDLAAWLRRVLSVSVFQAYGLTEAFTAVAASTAPFLGHGGDPVDIGVPSPACPLRLVDLPELGYHTTIPGQPIRGEIWVSGNSLFSGYWRNTDRTAEAMHDGWFRTGDVAELKSDSTLTLIDRQRSLFKFSQSESVPADYIEAVLVSCCTMVRQVWITGEAQDNFVMAVVVPELAHLRQALSVDDRIDDVTLCKKPEAMMVVRQELQKVASEKRLPQFMTARALLLEPRAFTVESGIMTPSFKLHRAALRRKYAVQLKELRASVLHGGASDRQ